MPVQTPALVYGLLETQLEASSKKVCSTGFPCQGKNNVDNKLVSYSGLCLTCENITGTFWKDYSSEELVSLGQGTHRTRESMWEKLITGVAGYVCI